ncbi:S-layer homology domain-containing protein [Paenibacillus cisolokensis]|uniref:S-layer homology domain-containing protein n=1 Tax=Paenibacillus cisolokensis TaxID=1658519 RepID=UPI003D26BF20
MKKLVMNKTAVLLVFMMVVSALAPVFAFAASEFQDVKHDYFTDTVTGSVYVSDDVYNLRDTYFELNDDRIVINVYGEDNTLLHTVYATYASTGLYKFSVNTATYSTYFPLKLSYLYDGATVTEWVYKSQPGGGGGFFPGGIIDSNGNVNRDQLIAALKASDDARILTTSEVVNLPADALIYGKNLTLYMQDGRSITLPLSALKVEDLAKSLGVELKDLIIRVELKQLTGDAAKALEDAVSAAGSEQLSIAVDFKVVAVGGGKEQAINNFGQLINRTIALDADASKDNAVGVLYDPTTKKLSFVPTTFTEDNGKTLANLKRNGNSIYTVIKGKSVSFTDLANHGWAAEAVNALAAKLVVEGTGADKFSPARNITRAEFAALIVRSLGIEAKGTSSFKDVPANAWYAGAVAAAAEAGIVKGVNSDTFKPTANITRKELATMVVRAAAYAGKEWNLTPAQVEQALAKFTDAAALGWAKDEVAAAISAGVVQGVSATKVGGDNTATRAEAATMIYRFLTNAELID